MTKDYALLFNGNVVTVLNIRDEWDYTIEDDNTVLFRLRENRDDLKIEVPVSNVSYVTNFDIDKFNIDDFIRKFYGYNVQIEKNIKQDFTITGYKNKILRRW